MNESYRPYLVEIRGSLAVSEYHVGSGARLSISTDAPLLRNTAGQPYLPASSLRGVLRAHLNREGPLVAPERRDLFYSLFGETPPREGQGESRAGRLRVFDAASGDCGSEIRDHVSIDPVRGSASTGKKFDQEVAEGGGLPFRVEYEGDGPGDGELVLLREAIRALEAGELSCGAKGGLGYGRMTLQTTQYAIFDRGNPADLAAWLALRLGGEANCQPGFPWPEHLPAGAARRPPEEAPPPRPLCRLEVGLSLQFDGPVLVRAPIPPQPGTVALDAHDRGNDVAKGLTTADRAFIQTGRDGRYYLPAASVRGVLRSQAGRIARLMGAEAVWSALFGSIGKNDGRKGLIEVSSGVLDGDARPVYLDHVAIDRVTGFAADARKFSTCGLESPLFQTNLRLRFPHGDLSPVALAGFVLRDLLGGWLWFGGGTTRGYGRMARARVTSCVVDWAPADTAPGDVAAGTVKNGRVRAALPLEDGALSWASEFWQRAEQAWQRVLPPAPAQGGQPR